MHSPIPILPNFNSFFTNYFQCFQAKTTNFFSKGYAYGKQTWQKTSQIATRFFHTSKIVAGYTKEIGIKGFQLAKKHPMYEYYIIPLRPFDYKLVGISSGLFIFVSLVALKRFGLISLYINSFLGAILGASLITILEERRNHFFQPKMCDLLYELQNLIHIASKNETNKANFQKCMNELCHPKYENKKEKWEEIKKKINELDTFLKKDFFEHKRDGLVFQLNKRLINESVNELIIELKNDKESIQQDKINKLLQDLSQDQEYSDITPHVLSLLELPSLKQEKETLIIMIDGIIASMKGKTFKERHIDNQGIVDVDD